MPLSLHKQFAYGSEQHDRIKEALLDRYRQSHNNLMTRVPAWTNAEKLYRAYQTKTDADRTRDSKRAQGTPEYTTVVLPFSYALLLTAHTYWTSVFLARDPVFQFTGRHGESQHKIQAVEAVMDYQRFVGQMLVPLYQWLLDTGKYGFGVVSAYWTEDWATTSRIVEEVPMSVFGLSIGKPKKTMKHERALSYAGNKLYNVRPHDFYYDPRVSLANFQNGEYCGRYVEVSKNTLMSSFEEYFNLEHLKSNYPQLGQRVRGFGGIQMPDDALASDFNKKQPNNMHALLEFVWELIPKDWGLGESTFPEKWVVTMADEDVIIGCRPQVCNHNKFPFALQMYEVDNYSNNSRGLLEIIEPLAQTLDWFFNSHFFNVRKSLNDQFVVDPAKIELQDLMQGGAGRLIRLRPQAYMTDVRAAISQLPVQNITTQHLRSISIILEMFYRVTGINDNLMGLMNTGGRKTATEVRTSSSFGVNRLKTFCEYNSGLGWAPLSQLLLQNTQQFMEEEQLFKVAGDLLQHNTNFMQVTPEDITGFYDFVPVDGTLPIDRFAQANLWKEILMGLAQVPAIGTQYDIAGIFSWMAQLAGLKNISQFKIQVMPDQQLMNSVEQGNMVPANVPTNGSAGSAGTAVQQAPGVAGPTM